jgi:4-amino-4-deoxy-L-arabinose transferase-like glycosyltransferase
VSGRRVPIAVLVVLVLLAGGFQAAYVLVPGADVRRLDGYDGDSHYAYLEWVRTHPDAPLAFRGSWGTYRNVPVFWPYSWVHFPVFYQWNAAVIDAVCGLGGADCERRGLAAAWLLQAVLRAATLCMLLAFFRRLLPSPGMAAFGLALAATEPRVFFAVSLWNQDEYVFFFATACLLLAVGAAQEGLAWWRIVAAGLAAALGVLFKVTMAVPLLAVLVATVFLPSDRAAARRKAAAIVVAALLMAALNHRMVTTADGRARLGWGPSAWFPQVLNNSEAPARAYLTLDPGPFVRPEPIFAATERRLSADEPASRHSCTTATYLYLFELYEWFQGPPRIWLNLLCVWTGTPLLGLALWRAGRTLAAPRASPIEDVLCATLVVLSGAALVYISLGLPYGWTTHPEYVLAAYPAAVALALRQLAALRTRPLVFHTLVAVAALHLVADAAMLLRVARFKIGW